jgi:AmiR/NasT family two-component response regulator
MPIRVLIAEDEWLTAMVLRSQVESHGLEVVATVGTGTEAIEACASTPPDLVLMDVQMPGMDGLQATRALMESSPTCVVIVTGRGQLREEAEQAGAMSYVVKPLLAHQIPLLVDASRRRFQFFMRVWKEAASPCMALGDWRVVQQRVRGLVAAGACSEEEALASLSRSASERGISLREIASEGAGETG